ncbi:ribosome quality control complex subunit NEMF-like [Lineus longissimus]|uniref:ribosome quality control complex subunit NEMF-like n=1 Tax=Lineus longissimus TaxID=88925 RepID=UPI002B4E11A1
MKTRYSTIDLRVAINEVNSKLLGLRVANCYDIDHKTYLIKLAKPDMKAMLLIESANKIHITGYEWPKNVSPSGFSMKLRKHLRTRRLEKIEQLGIDRIIDLQFGSGEAAYHLIVELYDKGNLVLTDFEYTILNILRVRSDESQDVKFAVREKYPLDAARQPVPLMPQDKLHEILTAAKDGDPLKKILNPNFEYGPAVIDHCLLSVGFPENAKIGKGFTLAEDMPKLMSALELAEKLLEETRAEGEVGKGGYIIQKRETKAAAAGNDGGELLTYHEFHPFKYKQHESFPCLEFETFNQAVDEFFSQIGSQKLDMKALQQEKTALKKLENVKKDHEKRVGVLQKEQEHDKTKAQLIEMNLDTVDRAIKIVCSALANQIDWSEIWDLVKEAQANGDPVASSIKGLKLDSNHITMLLGSPFSYLDSDEDEDSIKPCKIDIDLGLSGYANARRYYDMKRTASKKEQKTVESSTKALKSAERKTKQTLKSAQVAASINKARKVYWFEKFLWFISSENYLVIGGRDQQQNEIIYKKYLKPGDLYVHADLHGASSVIIKNHSLSDAIPPKTLNEAGVMAVCNSAAWDARVVTSAWYVYHDQVSKTAPTGEYLSTGSFMIRGKKNYLPPCYLQYGFGFVFKLDEDSIFRHKGERRVRTAEEDAASTVADSESVQDSLDLCDDEEDSGSSSDDGEEDEEAKEKMEAIDEGAEGQTEGQADLGETASKSDTKKDGANRDIDETVKADDDDASLFPDTNISLQHVGGTEFQLQREVSHEPAEDEDYKFYLGDDSPLTLGEKAAKSGAKISAKQRREMKKKKAKQVDEDGDQEDETKSSEVLESLHEADDSKAIEEEEQGEDSGNKKKKKKQRPKSGQQNQQESNQQRPSSGQQEANQQAPPKRGQKAKLKKMKEKYKDQDEEDRAFAMELLGSAGVKKESNKKQKGKKGPNTQQGKGRPQSAKKPPPKANPILVNKSEDVTIIEATDPNSQQPQKPKPEQVPDDGDLSDDEKQALLEEENLQAAEDVNTLDTLTGVPLPEDTILFAIPVCAPYNAMTNYKYKVKLTPGTTKRGKAAKTALNMYLHDRTATSREKDLLRTVKDNDTSRNIPGKVKVSAPNLHKNKKR